jgi:hypothetical protein
MKNTWVGIMAVMRTDGGSLSGSVAETSILPVADRWILPALSLDIGRALRLTLFGRLSNIITTPGTIQIRMKFGSVAVWDSGTMQMSTTAHTTVPFWFQALSICRSIGNSTNATMFSQGFAHSQALSLTAVADSTTTPANLLAPNSTPAVSSGFDSTVDNTVDVTAQFSVNNGGNLIQVHGGLIEWLN